MSAYNYNILGMVVWIISQCKDASRFGFPHLTLNKKIPVAWGSHYPIQKIPEFLRNSLYLWRDLEPRMEPSRFGRSIFFARIRLTTGKENPLDAMISLGNKARFSAVACVSRRNHSGYSVLQKREKTAILLATFVSTIAEIRYYDGEPQGLRHRGLANRGRLCCTTFAMCCLHLSHSPGRFFHGNSVSHRELVRLV